MDEIKKELGQHYLVEFLGCDAQVLQYVKDIESAMLIAAEKSRATIVKSHFSQFEPQGVSGFIFIQESHFSIHTWPEYNYAAFDVLTCGEMSPEKAIESLKESLRAREARVRVFTRGF